MGENYLAQSEEGTRTDVLDDVVGQAAFQADGVYSDNQMVVCVLE
jgi:hypothetical protein